MWRAVVRYGWFSLRVSVRMCWWLVGGEFIVEGHVWVPVFPAPAISLITIGGCMPVQVAVGIAIQRATVMGMSLPTVGTCLYHPDPAVFSSFKDRTGLPLGAFRGHTSTSM